MLFTYKYSFICCCFPFSIQNVQISGSILLDGEDAKGSNSGGGSGGTMSFVVDEKFEGHGTISVNGGKGSGQGGGGAGGRIFIDVGT